MPYKPHKKLDAWKYSFDSVKEIYRITNEFPSNEKYGLTSQIRRAAVSIPSNIAEGAGRKSKKEFLNFLSFTMRSLSELDTLLLLARDLNLINSEIADSLLNKLDIIGKLIFGLMKSLEYHSEAT